VGVRCEVKETVGGVAVYLAVAQTNLRTCAGLAHKQDVIAAGDVGSLEPSRGIERPLRNFVW
jgi:hypothetical protein